MKCITGVQEKAGHLIYPACSEAPCKSVKELKSLSVLNCVLCKNHSSSSERPLILPTKCKHVTQLQC